MTMTKDQILAEFEKDMRFAEIEWMCLKLVRVSNEVSFEEGIKLIGKSPYIDIISRMILGDEYESKIWELIQ